MSSCLIYKTLVFDCDGVILDSNRVKTQAFYQAALPYGETAAMALVDHHVTNGGVSRYKKFSYFTDHLVPQYAPDIQGPTLESLLEAYAEFVREGLLNCQVAKGLEELRAATANANWLIVSGGDQAELREVFSARGLDALFDGGIFGSPDTKDHILAREKANGNITNSALFLGDSKYDYQAATAAGLDFVFLHGWTEVSDWKSWVTEKSIATLEGLNELEMI